MDGKCHFIVFLLFVRYAISQKCDCKLLDILRNIVQREIMEREMLVSRVEMLESKQGSGTNNGADSSGYSSEANIHERLSVIETMIENINNKLKETSTERQNGGRLYLALTDAWRIHKQGLLVTNEDIQNKINDNNNRFNQLTKEAEKRKEVLEFKVESLINQTNDKVAKQLDKLEDRFEVIHVRLNKTFQEYTTKMNKDFTIFINQTDRTLNGIRTEITSDECGSDPCKNGATCVDGVQSYTCICMTGYGGSQCQIDVDECESNPCLNGATCVTGINNYACKCAAGYEGTNCQIDINECDSNPCVNGGTCVNRVNGYACTCVGGYTGTNCQTDINECASSPCVNGGTCVNLVNSYACTCAGGYTGTNCQIDISGQYDCAGIRKKGVTKSGVYTVTLWKTKSEIQVFCDMTTDSGGWTVFQNRFDGSVDFYQNFASYVNGFGHLSGEFWLGLKYIQKMTLMSQTELRVDLRAADGSTAYEVFQNFRLTEGPDYKLNIDPGTGTAGDSAASGLSFNNDSRFSTFDRDADNSGVDDCARNCHGGWWYSKCSYVNLNGHYAEPGTSSSYTSGWGGMIYYPFKQTDSLKSSKMMLRRVT